MIERASIVAKAREYIDTPFHHQGRVKAVGIDCVGLVIGVAHELGLSDFDVTGYSRQPDPIQFRAIMRAQLTERTFAQRQAGDVLSFAFIAEQHVGIVTSIEPLTIVHCWAKVGRCVEHIVDAQWARRIRGVWTFPGVA